MFTGSKSLGRVRHALIFTIVGALMCLLAAPALGDEFQYLPTETHFLASVNVSALLKSKTYQEAKKLSNKFEKDSNKFEKEIEEGVAGQLGMPITNVSRITYGASFASFKDMKGNPDDIGMATTFKPVTADDIKSKVKASPFEKNLAFKEIKVGKFTIYQKTFELNFGGDEKPKMQEGQAFCVVESKLVLFGQLEPMKKILERNKKPELSANLKTGLQIAGLTNSIAVVWDIEGMPKSWREDLVARFAKTFPDAKDVADNVKLLAIKVNEIGQVNAAMTLVCKDSASAGTTKKAADAALVTFKGKLVADDKAPPELQELVKGARKLVDTVKISTVGNRVNGNVAAPPATMVQFLAAMIVPTAPKKAPDSKDEIKKDSK
jgi:hypothetical protein